MKTIKRLPKNVHSSLRSSIILSDLPRVVEELIYNSIDANASKIDIAVNVRGCYVKVEDDGCGITRDELVLLGEKYATSKSHSIMDNVEHNPRSFGVNGEALASLSDISVVEVRTKARGRPNSYCKIIKGSTCLHLGIDDQREVVGTTVVVRELFYNQPVRRKQMHSREKRELHHLKNRVLQIALIHPLISIRLLDIDREDEFLCTAPSSSPLPLISKSFGDNVSRQLHEIAASEQDWVLSGHISGPTDVFCTKDLQYLYINSRFVSRNPIHNMINNVAASFQSSIVRKNEGFDVQGTKRQKIDIYPAYMLNFCCPRSSYDLHFEPTRTIVEFKDWQTVLSFIEQTVTNYWKKHALQSSKVADEASVSLVADEASVDGTDVHMKKDVKLNHGILKHHNMQKKEDCASFQSAQHENAFRDINFDMGAKEALKGSCCFSFDTEPSLWHASSGRIINASQLNNDVTSIDYKFERKQAYSPESGSYRWLEDGPAHLEDDISGVNSTSWEMQWTEGIYQEYAYSGKFGMLEDLPTDGFLTLEHESDFIDLESEIQEPFFRVPYRPNRMTCDYVQNQNHMFTNTSGQDGFCVEFEKLIERCLANEATHEISQLNGGFYHDYGSTSRGFCGGLRKCSTKFETAHPSVDGLEADTISQMNFPDIHPVWSGDVMDRSSIKDTFHHFSPPLSLLDTPFSRTRTDLKFHRRSNKSFDSSNCANIDREFRFNLDRFNNDQSIICEGTKHLANSEYETQRLNYCNNGRCSSDHSNSEDLTSSKSKFGARLSDDISCVKSAKDSHLNVLFFKMANGSTLAQDLLNRHNSICNQRSRLSKDSRSRSHSAPPFYRGKQKYTRINEPLSVSTTNCDKNIFNNNQEDNAPTPMDISHVSATQPVPETDSSGFPDLNFSSNGYTKMSEDACSDGLEDTTAQITKWRDVSGQQTALDLPQGTFGCCDDVLSISSGTFHLSRSSLVPECVDRNCFEEARVLLQLDKKFIPVISGETILLVDQHAADERIRLEDLRNKILSEESRVVTYLDSEEELFFPETGFQLFQKYAEQIQKWGWIIKSDNTSSGSFKKNMNIMRRQSRLVTLVAVPCILGVNLTGKDLMEFIHQLDETDGSSAIPPAVLRILNFKACRGAIMFGDALLPSECCLIIEELKETSLCFQCAHGRPTTVPIVNIASVHDQLGRLEMLSGRRTETWHGLAHQRPSLERAQTRLKQVRKLRRRL